MNKEQFRKELEDCWDASNDSFWWNTVANNDRPEPPNKSTFITTRLAAIDDGDWLRCSLDAQQCQQECEHKEDRTKCPFTKSTAMNNWNEQARELLQTIVENASPADHPHEYYLHQIALDKSKELLLVDDGQEGKGLEVELESIEKFVYLWLESKGFVKVSEHRWQNGLTEIVVTDYGYNVQFMHDDNEMAETSLRGHSIYQLSGYLLWNNLIAALPVADGEGRFIWTDELVEELIWDEYGDAAVRFKVGKFKQSKSNET